MSKRSPPANPYRPSRPTRSVALKNPSYSDETYHSDDDDKPAAATTTSNTSKPKRLALADRSNSMTLSSHVILRNNCSATTNNNFFLKSEIISDYKTMSAQKIAEKWHLTEGKPYFSESWPSVESCTSRYVRFIPIESRQLFYQRNVQVAHGISLTTRHLLRDYVKIILFYMRTPIKRDTPTTTNLYRTACPIKVNNSLNMRSDINRIHPNNFPIFRISPANAYLHKRIMHGLEGLTTELGRHQDDEFSIYFVKYMANEGMGAHGDYGGLKAEKYHMMRISLGIGGSREIRFFAKEIDPNSKDDATGTFVEDLGFQLVMSGCRNAYMMTHFGDGMMGMCLSDQHGTSVIRAGHKVKMIKPDKSPCVTAVISFPLRSIEGVATSLRL